MTEYWKSQAKKYCDFCKCWIADNAPNVSFHVNGWKHKENVKRKISEMTKQSQKEYKNQLQVGDEIKKMEEAAMKAYMKDIEASADITSKVIQETIAEEQKAKISEAEENVEDKDEDVDEDKEEEEALVAEDKKWYEAQSDEGHTYYWHVETGESVWVPPEEGYVSMAQQKAEEKQQRKQQAAEARRVKAEEERKVKEQAEEDRARQEREKMKSRRKVEEKPEEPDQTQDASAVVIGPAPKVDPYGGWTVVDNRLQKPVDLQLPQQEYVAIKMPLETTVEVPQRRFKEKTISGLSDNYNEDGPVGFKKRKLGSNTKKNVRQRLDTDC